MHYIKNFLRNPPIWLKDWCLLLTSFFAILLSLITILVSLGWFDKPNLKFFVDGIYLSQYTSVSSKDSFAVIIPLKLINTGNGEDIIESVSASIDIASTTKNFNGPIEMDPHFIVHDGCIKSDAVNRPFVSKLINKHDSEEINLLFPTDIVIRDIKDNISDEDINYKLQIITANNVYTLPRTIRVNIENIKSLYNGDALYISNNTVLTIRKASKCNN